MLLLPNTVMNVSFFYSNGQYNLTVLNSIPTWFESIAYAEYVAYIDIDSDKIELVLEESERIHLINAADGRDICNAKIAPQNFKNIKPVLYLLLSRSDVDKLRNFPYTQVENGLLFNVKVIFEPKRSYYDSLLKVITQIPNFTIEKILPSLPRVLQLPTTHTRNISNVCEIEALTVNDEYRVRLLRDMLRSPPDIPIIISGPAGTGKTRLLARATYEFVMNGLSSSSPTRILICTHNSFRAKAYMEQYLIPAFQGKNEVQIVRVMRQSKKEEEVFNNVHYVEYANLKIIDTLAQVKSVVVVTTFMTSLKIVNQIKSKDFYFTHIILDEAALVREPVAIAPLCLGNKDTKIIMAGDVKQVYSLFVNTYFIIF